jgi:hypothetical protein
MKNGQRRLEALEDFWKQVEAPDHAEWFAGAEEELDDRLNQILELVPEPSEGLDGIVVYLWGTLENLKWMADRQFRRDASPVEGSLADAAVLVTLLERAPEDLRGEIGKAVGGRDHPLKKWIFHLARRHSRLPDDLSEDVLRRVLDAYLADPDLVDDVSYCCDRCQLQRPQRKRPPLSEWKLLPGKTWGVGEPPWYDLPEFFDNCPACGCTTWNWTHLCEPIP